ncbi:helical backbone metal receptor [Candidatus Eisenbacteria bacterium]|uniref:Helical backbone metal receptor n=1 Tax=Eiseniibacteriota bacterium TaxID=2212470 RepID=A0ABV6YI29_UNCEI
MMARLQNCCARFATAMRGASPVLIAWLMLTAPQIAVAGPASVHTGTEQTFEDALGHRVVWTEPPARIVSLSPNLTEILFAIQCDSAIVGVTRFCNHPPAALELPRIGGVVDPSLEAIMMLRPELVLATRGNPVEFLESLAGLKLPVFALETRGDTEQIFRTILSVGKVTGRDVTAGALVDSLRALVRDVTARTAGLDPALRPRVFMGELDGAHWSAGPGSFVHALIEAAGGENVAAIAPAAWSPLSLESIVASDPQVYLGTFAQEGEVAARELVLHTLRTQPGWKDTSLGAEPRVFLVHEDRLQRPGPRVFGVLVEFARELHPSLWVEPRRGTNEERAR